jgi:hypothetical protein
LLLKGNKNRKKKREANLPMPPSQPACVTAQFLRSPLAAPGLYPAFVHAQPNPARVRPTLTFWPTAARCYPQRLTRGAHVSSLTSRLSPTWTLLAPRHRRLRRGPASRAGPTLTGASAPLHNRRCKAPRAPIQHHSARRRHRVNPSRRRA